MANEYVNCPGCDAKISRSRFEKKAGTDMSLFYHDECRHHLIIRGDDYPIFDPMVIFNELRMFEMRSKISDETDETDHGVAVFSESREWPFFRLVKMRNMCERYFPKIRCRFLKIHGKNRLFLGGEV